MGKATGFLEFSRRLPDRRPVAVRVRDWREVYEPFPEQAVREQAARCMDCGIPFCHLGCPLGNLIPEWNDLSYRGWWADAADRLHATNNFPEFTGRLCPAPCEAACVLGINSDAVTIERMEYEIAERSFAAGITVPLRPNHETGKSVAVVGSGPAGLAAAQQLRRAGHRVEVIERSPRPGGLLRYGIPEFKLEKRILDRRLEQLVAEGVEFRCGVEVVWQAGGEPQPGLLAGSAGPSTRVELARVEEQFDAVVLSVGTPQPRDLPIPGRDLAGVHLALEYLVPSNLVREGILDSPPVDANGKRVVIIGGGDTGADCLGTAHRQGAVSVTQLEILPRPPEARPEAQPWPGYPIVFRVGSAHEEGGERLYSITTNRFLGGPDGRLRALACQEVETAVEGGRVSFRPIDGTEREIACELAILALGFAGAGHPGEGPPAVDERHRIEVDSRWMTMKRGVFACGDAARGQSLVVWAIAEGRSCAAAVDSYLTGRDSLLPAPLAPGSVAIA